MEAILNHPFTVISLAILAWFANRAYEDFVRRREVVEEKTEQQDDKVSSLEKQLEGLTREVAHFTQDREDHRKQSAQLATLEAKVDSMQINVNRVVTFIDRLRDDALLRRPVVS